MVSPTVSRDDLMPPREERMGKPLMLAAAAHLGLVAALALGVNWRASEPEGLQAELWAAVPQVAAPRAPTPPEPTPAPPPPPPPPRPAPPPPPPGPAHAKPPRPRRNPTRRLRSRRKRRSANSCSSNSASRKNANAAR